jgi:predicted enzyme related to lactoylglutathione lyase
MPNNVTHFDVHADDLARCRRFYEKVFGWRFTPWGPPDFFLIATGDEKDPGIHGGLSKRHGPAAGAGMTAFICTVGVDDIDATAKAVEKYGGTITTEKMTIPTVGKLIQFKDTEGNVVSAMQYDAR